jgi:hypothetical protein
MKKITRDDMQEIAVIMEIKDGDRLLSAAKLLRDFETVSPVIVASYMICLYEIFEEIISEADQIDFQKNTFSLLKRMVKEKEEHTEIIYIERNKQDEDEEDEDDE